MIRLALQCAFVFLLPAVLYFGYVFLVDSRTAGTPDARKTAGQILDEAPLVWLFALGTLMLFGSLVAFATLQDQSVDKPYAPAIYKDGKIQQGQSK